MIYLYDLFELGRAKNLVLIGVAVMYLINSLPLLGYTNPLTVADYFYILFVHLYLTWNNLFGLIPPQIDPDQFN